MAPEVSRRAFLKIASLTMVGQALTFSASKEFCKAASKLVAERDVRERLRSRGILPKPLAGTAPGEPELYTQLKNVGLSLSHKFNGYGLKMMVYQRHGGYHVVKDPPGWTAATLVERMTTDYYEKNPDEAERTQKMWLKFLGEGPRYG